MHYEDRFMIEWDREAVLEWAKKEGETSAQKAMVKNLISSFGFTDEQAANAALVSIDFVKQARLEMDKEL